jgi:hypothetical protein
MAEIVLGIGCTHTPQLHTPADLWDIRAKRDREDGVPLWYRGRRLTYADVKAERAAESLGAQTALDVRESRLRKSHAAIDRVAGILADVAPDVVVIFGNDQDEMFLDDVKPAFTIMGASRFENMPRTEEQVERLPPGIALSDSGHLPDDEIVELPGHPDLAEYIAGGCTAAGFDVAYSRRQLRADAERAQTAGMPHAYGFVYKQLMRARPVPNVPVDTNTLYPPNQPSASRCFAFGEAVGNAIRAWDEPLRVAVIASGGLSHFVVDEAFDREIMTAMAGNDFERLTEYAESYFQSGSSEIKSWIAAGGAMRDSGLAGEIIEYQPLYRTPAGTGSSAAFMVWR